MAPRLFWTLAAAVALAVPAVAQDTGRALIGNDSFLAGGSVVEEGEGIDDVFAAADTFRLAAPITGSAFAAGRRVEIDAPAAADVFAAGMEVSVTADIGGDVTVAGYEVSTDGAVGGDLRASGARVSVSGPVAGYASLAGESLEVDVVVAGDMHVGGRRVEFGPSARVDGTLFLYEEEPGRIDVTESVAPQDRITRVAVEDWGADGMPAAFRPPSWQRLVLNFLLGVLFIAAAAALIAAVLPGPLADLRRTILAAPLRSLWFGFLSLSTLVGAAIVLAITVIGLFVTPAAIVVALFAGFVGYVVGAYALGVGLMMALGRGEPTSLGPRVVAAAVGALVAGIVALIPFLGWLFVLAVTLAGVGALTLRSLRPRFFAAPQT